MTIDTKVLDSKVKVSRSYRNLCIIADTREQEPLWLPPLCSKEALIVGDYTTNKLKRKFIIERKSPGDLYGTITKGHERFKREIKRAIENKIKMVVYVECSRLNFVEKRFPGGAKRKYPGTGLDRIVRTLEIRYKLEFVWCKDRNEMRSKVLKRLKKEENQINHGNSKRRTANRSKRNAKTRGR